MIGVIPTGGGSRKYKGPMVIVACQEVVGFATLFEWCIREGSRYLGKNDRNPEEWEAGRDHDEGTND